MRNVVICDLVNGGVLVGDFKFFCGLGVNLVKKYKILKLIVLNFWVKYNENFFIFFCKLMNIKDWKIGNEDCEFINVLKNERFFIQF